ncbi:MAG: hypothetical protein KIT16_04250 [Rhodospirillaceae bacterium]|nr:hypothetical protein [Rhodospirillaceae bacterium]
MIRKALAFAAILAAGPVLAEAPPKAPPPAAVWTKTKALLCEVQQAHNCTGTGCASRARLPSFRIDIKKQTMCGMVQGQCRNQIKIGEIGLDGGATRMTVHALGVAFVVGIDADGAMNGADVVKGRVVVIQGRCTSAE